MIFAGGRRGYSHNVDAAQIGRFLLLGAVVLAVAGGLLLLGSALGTGRLPGDLSFGKGTARVFLPLASCIVLSAVATIVLNVFFRR